MSERTNALTTTTSPTALATTLASLLDDSHATLEAVQAHLAALDGAGRIAECRSLGKRQQSRLFKLAATAAAVGPEEMILGVPDGEPVRWYGRNTLPVFRLFEKRFRRFEGQVVGYNHNPWLVTFATGPGYYVCRIDGDKPKELLIDYTLLPASAPPGWPKVKSNLSGLSRFVYGNMYDYCRRVSDTVVIGAATRFGKPLGQYFILCRG